ncbi:Sorting nexin-4 [Diplonema papillatum]|nr:Sorting nexin-4 [Diplonema papillatum]
MDGAADEGHEATAAEPQATPAQEASGPAAPADEPNPSPSDDAPEQPAVNQDDEEYQGGHNAFADEDFNDEGSDAKPATHADPFSVPNPTAEEAPASDDERAAAPDATDSDARMPEPSAFYTDAALFLPVQKEVMSFTIPAVHFVDRSYWVYEVHLTTNLPLYQQDIQSSSLDKAYKKHIRYSKFGWLKTALATDYPAIIVPPVPPKDVMANADKIAGLVGVEESDGCPPIQVRQRQRELQYFLNYLASHPAMRESILLKDFLVCPDSQFQALKDTTSAVQARLQAEHKRIPHRGAMGWLKSKVTTNSKLAEMADPEYVVKSAWVSAVKRNISDLQMHIESLYVQRLSRTEEKLPCSTPLTAAEWAHRGINAAHLKPGTRVQTKHGQIGTVRWSGSHPDGAHSADQVFVGVEWDNHEGGTCDGQLPGKERCFKGKFPRGSSFVDMHSLYIPLPTDSVVAAVDALTAEVTAHLSSLSMVQEKRLFHLLSDLQIIRGWLDSILHCVAHFNECNAIEAAISNELAHKRSGKKMDPTPELQLEDRLQKHQKSVAREKTTFKAELEKAHGTVHCLWRGLLTNFTTYYQNLETKQGLDRKIEAMSHGIRAVWN